jgi:hypothetical protein
MAKRAKAKTIEGEVEPRGVHVTPEGGSPTHRRGCHLRQ